MSDLLEEIGAYLQTAGLLTLGTDGFLGTMLDKPDAQVAIYEPGGAPPLETFGATALPVNENPRVQVVCRGASEDYLVPRNKAKAIYRALAVVTDALLNGGSGNTRYLRITPVDQPFLMGRDDNQRVLIACNFDVMKELSP